MYSSRFIRPVSPFPIRLSVRDSQILARVFEHRYLTADHVRKLAGGEGGRRAIQRRLRLLWSVGLLDRACPPAFLRGTNKTQPLVYSLASAARDIVASELGLPMSAVFPPTSRIGLTTLEHGLVVADFLSALGWAARNRGHRAVLEPESVLLRHLAAWRRSGRTTLVGAVVPDGAVTLTHPPKEKPVSFEIEVVRCGAPGGNESVRQKMLRYVELNRSGFLRDAFGHARVRAVLIAAPTIGRAKNLATLAQNLPHGRRLFWFAAYREGQGDHILERTVFTPEHVLLPMWQDASGARHGLTEAFDELSSSHST